MKHIDSTIVSIAICLIASGCSATTNGAANAPGTTPTATTDNATPAATNNAPTAPSTSSGIWKIHQTSDVAGMSTEQDLVFSPEGSRCESKGSVEITYVIHKSPDWHVTAFSKKTKLMYDTPIEQWKKDRKEQHDATVKMKEGIGGKDKDTPYKADGTETIAGMNATRYVSKSADGSTVEAWLTEDIKPTYEQRGVFTKELDGLPEGHFMLRMVITTDGEKSKALDTTKVEKLASVPSGLLDVPSGFKKVKKELDVVMGAGADKDFKDMAEAFGGDEK